MIKRLLAKEQWERIEARYSTISKVHADATRAKGGIKLSRSADRAAT